jgi:chromosome segregation ATPase
MLLLVAALSPVLTGCDSQASQQAEAQRHLEAARAKLSLANAGYITSDAAKDVALLEYRQDTMDAAFEDLNKVMSLDAPQEKAQALRLAADIDASAARHAARRAAIENAALSGRSTVLLGYLAAIEGSASRAEALKPQYDQRIAELQAEIQEQNAQHEQLVAEASTLEKQVQDVSARAQEFKARADEVYAQAQKLREQAFVTSGDRMYDLQDQAAELERQAAKESASAEEQQVLVNDLTARLELARAQIATTEQLLAELNEQVKAVRTNAARQADESTEAANASEEAVKMLAEEYKNTAGVYEEAVQKNMALAGEKAEKAVNGLTQAVSLAQGGRGATDAESVRLQLLAAYVNQAHIATTHATYLRDMVSMTRTILNSVEHVAPEAAEMYRSQITTLSQTEADLNETASKAVEAGLELAAELAPEGSTAEDSEVVAIAMQQKDRLQTYSQLRG